MAKFEEAVKHKLSTATPLRRIACNQKWQ